MSIDARFNENKQHSGRYFVHVPLSNGGEEALIGKSVTLLHEKERNPLSKVGIILHSSWSAGRAGARPPKKAPFEATFWRPLSRMRGCVKMHFLEQAGPRGPIPLWDPN